MGFYSLPPIAHFGNVLRWSHRKVRRYGDQYELHIADHRFALRWARRFWPEKRELTELELQVSRRLHRILEHLRYSWSDIEEIAPQLEAMDTNPQ